MGAPQTLAKFGIGRRLIAGERQGEFTAQRLKKLAPHVYEAIIKLRGQDWGFLRIADLLQVSHRTVAAIDTAEPEAIDVVRQRMTRKLLQCSHLLLERIEKDPESVPIHLAGLVCCQLLDKAEQLEGRKLPNQVTFTKVNIFEDWKGFLASLEQEHHANTLSMPSLPASEPPILDAVITSQTPAESSK